ncbi:MAG: DNA-formamidopyrimidine glycosylase [bacterium]|nr:DNA-formamidopyrimidine glycosylase [bacterium]
MPELPEVETVRSSLKKLVVGEVINKVIVNYQGVIKGIEVAEFIDKLKNQTINDIKRRGKWIIFELDDYDLLSHLRMEGKYFIKDKIDDVLKHEHVIFELSNRQLRYHDTRKFGVMYLIEKGKRDSVLPLKKLGVEPLTDDLTVEYLKDKYKNNKKAIKTTLLDQEIITGIGNIYADEILFLSHINPLTITNKLSNKQLTNIVNNTKLVLKKAISLGGTTILSYTSVDGIHGLFQNELLVHGKEKCLTCDNAIIKIRVGGRGTYYCKKCQK